MKQAIRFWLMIWLSAVCCSCGDSGKAKETAEAFLDALRLNDEAKYVELYPEIKKISPMLSFNQYTIEEVVSKETCYEVVILGTREGDEKTSKKLKLYFSKDKHGEVVTDSQGFTAIEMSCKNFYLKSHGVYSESDTDLTIAKKIKEAETYWLEAYALSDTLLRKLITCKYTWKIEGYTDYYAKCSGVMVNHAFWPSVVKNLRGVFYKNGSEVSRVSFNLDHNREGKLEPSKTYYFDFTDFDYHQADGLRIDFDLEEESVLGFMYFCAQSAKGDEYAKNKGHLFKESGAK